MATQATNIELENGSVFARLSHAVAAPVKQAFAAIGHGLMALSEAASRAREIEAYQMLSDKQLAERGLRRDDIVRHVFRDKLFL